MRHFRVKRNQNVRIFPGALSLTALLSGPHGAENIVIHQEDEVIATFDSDL